MIFKPKVSQKLVKEDVELLWKCGYWDGVLSGFLKWNGEIYWFQMFCENPDRSDERWFRRFGLYVLEKEQWEYEKRKHEDFQLFVGYTSDYGVIAQKGLHSKDSWNLFYDKYKNSPVTNYNLNPLIAILEM